MKYLIFGNGYLGNKFHEQLQDSIIDPADITDVNAVLEAIDKHQPETIINCAGKTGKPNVDWCEDHKFETIMPNLLGPLNLLRVCKEKGIYFVQLSSGCIYAGDNNGKGWSEDDEPNFDGSYYSKAKGWMNQILKDFDVLQIRLRMPLDAHPGPRNFITKIANYPKVISVPNSITIIDDMVVATKQLMDKKALGIYNMVNPGAIEHKDILALYKEIVDPNHVYELITLEELEKNLTKAKRSNAILSMEKLANEGITMPPIQDRIRDLLIEYKKNLDLL